MSRVDAFFLVGVCATATEFHTDRALAEISQETILKLNGPQAIKGTTAEADRCPNPNPNPNVYPNPNPNPNPDPKFNPNPNPNPKPNPNPNLNL